MGLVAYVTLPVAHSPEIATHSIEIRAAYPGASAETVADAADRFLWPANGARPLAGRPARNVAEPDGLFADRLVRQQELVAVTVGGESRPSRPRLERAITEVRACQHHLGVPVENRLHRPRRRDPGLLLPEALVTGGRQLPRRCVH